MELFFFRNLEHVRLDLNASLQVFSGRNAQGKTNLLEAIALLSRRRSFRAQKEEELIFFGSEECRVSALVESAGQEAQVEIVFSRGRPKKFLVNGKRPQREGPPVGIITLVLFTPEEVSCPSGGSSARRGLIDNYLFLVSASYKDNWSRYYDLLSQRQKLLDDILKGQAGQEMLEPWDTLLAQTGWLLMQERERSVTRLALRSAFFYKTIAALEQGETLELRYEKSWERLSGKKAPLGEEVSFFKECLKQDRAVEIRRGQTMVGPHRDDVSFWLNQKPLKHFGSRGQHRSAVLAFKLAEWEALREEKQEPPLLLLDDVLSELDEKRQGAILNLLQQGSQMFITSADEQGAGLALFRREAQSAMTLWRLEDGKVMSAR